jgi:protein TilB
LQHLSLAGNALGRLPLAETRGLRSLRSLNLALNCLRRLPSPEVSRGLESLERLDLTANFLDAPALFALRSSLGEMPRLAELWLAGNPGVVAVRQAVRQGGDEEDAFEEEEDDNNDKSSADMYRATVLLALPRLKRLDGQDAPPSERLAARRLATRARAALLRASSVALQEEAQGTTQKETLAALEAAVVAGEQHPETLALYGPPPEAAGAADETSESESEGEGGGESHHHHRRGRRLLRPRLAETGRVDPETGELRRPWCPATRLLDLRDQRRQQAAATAAAAGAGALPSPASSAFAPVLARSQPRRIALPSLPDDDPGTGETLPLRNEGRWRFSLDLVGRAAAHPQTKQQRQQKQPQQPQQLELDVDVGRHVDTSQMQLEVLPRAVRLLVRGRLLQLRLPAEVRADAGAAQRSKATGRLRVLVPLERPENGLEDVTLVRPRWSVWGGEEEKEEEEGGRKGKAEGTAAVVAAAAAVAVAEGEEEEDEEENPPPL